MFNNRVFFQLGLGGINASTTVLVGFKTEIIPVKEALTDDVVQSLTEF